MNPFNSLHDYETFVYSIPQHFTLIRQSTLVIAQFGPELADLTGELTFRNDYRLIVSESLVFPIATVKIRRYGYECWSGSVKLYWYDSQPHPHVPELASTEPHHKHVPPNIKRNRIPAPELSFNRPNLPFLISEIEQLLSPTP